MENEEILRTAGHVFRARATAQAVAWTVIAVLVWGSCVACVWLFLLRGETRWAWAALFWLLAGLMVTATNRLPGTAVAQGAEVRSQKSGGRGQS